MSYFVERFNELLKNKKLTLRTLSNLINISSLQLSRYASGNYQPSVKNAVVLSNYFNCSLDYLFGLDNIPKRFEIKRNEEKKLFYERFSNLIALRKTNFNHLSKITNINRNTFYIWQKQNEFPKASLIAEIAIALHTNIEFLIGRIDEWENYNAI